MEMNNGREIGREIISARLSNRIVSLGTPDNENANRNDKLSSHSNENEKVLDSSSFLFFSYYYYYYFFILLFITSCYIYITEIRVMDGGSSWLILVLDFLCRWLILILETVINYLFNSLSLILY